MSILFESIKIGNFEIKNRFVRSATYYALSDRDGFISQASVDLMRQLAENEVGLIVSGFAYVLKNGQSVPDMNGIQTDEHIPSYKKMTKAVHDADGRIVMQIVHGGANAYSVSIWGGDYLAVSVTENMPRYGIKAREMTDEDIEKIIQAFGQAARRVQEAGFDGVQIHGAHGYLVSQFLSPLTNRREDKWGGSIENRMRFVAEVTRAIKKQVDQDFPVMIKLGCRDFTADGSGLTIQEGAQVAGALENEGLCFIEISNGYPIDQTMPVGINAPEKEAFYLPEARVIREAITSPLCLVGGMRSLPVMEEVIKSGTADCVSLSRPLIREPNLIKHWKDGDTKPADCISCGGCFNHDGKGGHDIYCRQLKKKEKKQQAK
ncbi:MAG: NADH:flavin oxidoreductase [Deltaproteobacteria bacterium]|nr:NADH:flavin oxidoreductase [Deltaproteobacteria bacterium]MBW2051639.1 NADH:flavin oxidoreductase [Deltaproteobacteria bacterium]MBW2141330.1 NADH:flavin oxidoreductase [Deltaproteobacteria bacterium]MBW2322406.1 NADH:flavin oxidoreductase [Deltaproteobacteria bacterium]